MSDIVQLVRDEGVATITLNRPNALNALNDEMLLALRDVVAEVEHDAAVRCVVVTAAGAHFMGGGDLKFFHEELKKDPSPAARRVKFERFVGGLQPVVLGLRRMQKPVIASVRGAAAGFGMSLVMACDLAVCADDAMFTLAYVHIATSPDGSSSYMLPRLVGMKRAMEIALLGDRFDAKRALELGLVNQVVPKEQLEEATRSLARRLSRGPTQAYARTKALLLSSFESSLEEQLRCEAEAFAACSATHDFAEGIAAFNEKRKPTFTGA